MDIQAFFQLSAGKWSSIKSDHHVDVTQQQSGRSMIEMELLEPDHAAIAQLCQAHQISPDQIVCAAQVKWDGFLEGDTKNQVGSQVMAAIASTDDRRQGKLLRTSGRFATPAPATEFVFGAGNEITLTTEQGGLTMVERIWYESDNVRMRHTKIYRPDGSNSIVFCSEIRLGVTKPSTST
ncbi:MAG: phycobiliprotein lyase [Synechococcales bacterium]|nr:phycobiliprotein lyase [Synechococcales bacterium]